MHWHATAAEWGYLVDGRCRTTVLSPDGSAETNDFDPGDVWYFPKGHPHSIQGLGPGICHFVLIFDNGAFSEFGTFSVTDWLGHSAASLLTKNLGIDTAAQKTLPHDEVYFARGPVPPAEQAPYLGHFPRPEKSHKFRMMSQQPHFAGLKRPSRSSRARPRTPSRQIPAHWQPRRSRGRVHGRCRNCCIHRP